MRLVIQKVSHASCTVEGTITGKIGVGFMVLVGFTHTDDEAITKKMAEKMSKLRIFEDENGKINKSIYDVGGSVLSISQFTLYANCKKGNRPSFDKAMPGNLSTKLYDYFNECLRDLGLTVETGIFGADMKIVLLNDGPITIVLDSEEI